MFQMDSSNVFQTDYKPLNDEDREYLQNIGKQLEFQDKFFKVDGFQCRHCKQVAVIHRIADCGDTFCKNCYEEFLDKECPVCGREIHQFNQDTKFERRLMEQKVYCTNRQYGCNETVTLNGLAKHIHTCKYLHENVLPEHNNERPIAETLDMLIEDVNKIKDSVKAFEGKFRTFKFMDRELNSMFDKLRSDVSNLDRRMNSEFLEKRDNDRFRQDMINMLSDHLETYQSNLHKSQSKLFSDQNDNVRDQLASFQREINDHMKKQVEELRDENFQQLDEIEKKIFPMQEFEWKLSDMKEEVSDHLFSNLEKEVMSMKTDITDSIQEQLSILQESQHQLQESFGDNLNYLEMSYVQESQLENTVTTIVNRILQQQQDTDFPLNLLTEQENSKINLLQKSKRESKINVNNVLRHDDVDFEKTDKWLSAIQKKVDSLEKKIERLEIQQPELETVIYSMVEQFIQEKVIDDIETKIGNKIKEHFEKTFTDYEKQSLSNKEEKSMDTQIKEHFGNFVSDYQEEMAIMENKIDKHLNCDAVTFNKMIEDQCKQFFKNYQDKQKEQPFSRSQTAMIVDIFETLQSQKNQIAQDEVGLLHKQLEIQLKKFQTDIQHINAKTEDFKNYFDMKLKNLEDGKHLKPAIKSSDNSIILQSEPASHHSKIKNLVAVPKTVLPKPKLRHDQEDVRSIRFTWAVEQIKQRLLANKDDFPVATSNIPDPYKLFGCDVQANCEIRVQTNTIVLWVEFKSGGNNLNTDGMYGKDYFVKFTLLDQSPNSVKKDIVLISQPQFKKHLMPKALVTLPTKILKSGNNSYVVNNSIKISIVLQPLNMLYKSVLVKNGTLTFKIDNYSERKLDEVNGVVPCIYSDSFYTSEKGYRVHAKLYLNGCGAQYRGKFISIYAGFLVGEWDKQQEVPFKYSVTFHMLPKDESSKVYRPPAHSKSMKTNVPKIVNRALHNKYNSNLPKPTNVIAPTNRYANPGFKWNAFIKKIENRVYDERTPYFGFPNFCLQHEVEKFYLKEDCLILKVEVTID